MYGSVRSYAQGTGMALMHMTSTVNVEYAHQIRNPSVHAFNLWIDKLEFHGRNFSHMSMSVCARYDRSLYTV